LINRARARRAYRHRNNHADDRFALGTTGSRRRRWRHAEYMAREQDFRHTAAATRRPRIAWSVQA